MVLLGSSAIFFQKYRNTGGVPEKDSVSAVDIKVEPEEKSVPEDWGRAMSASGFSVRYPSDKVGVIFGDNREKRIFKNS